MGEIKDRIKYFRKTVKKMTQEDFAKEIDMSRSNLANIETGKINLIDRVISTICTRFQLSKEWLLTGQGDMYIQTDDKIVAQLVEKYNMTDEQRQVMEIFLDMPEEKRQLVAKAFFALLDTANAHKQPVLSPVSDADVEEETKELEAYRQEYRAVKRGVFPSVSGNDGTHGGGTK